MEQEIYPGVTRTWLEAEQIAVYHISAVNVNMLMHWNRHLIEMLKSWNDDAPCLLVYDLSKGGVSLPYLVFSDFHIDNVVVHNSNKVQIDRMMEARPRLRIALALVITTSVSGRIMLGRVQHDPTVDRMTFDIFFNRENAIDWLKSVRFPGVDESESAQP
ncbi:MAG: hypothetical protein SF162_17965 [bacterium]|nr:hypothetical protein [bacterium]